MSIRITTLLIAATILQLAPAQNPVRLALVPWAQNLGPVVDIAHCGDSRLFAVRQFGQIDIVVDSMSVLVRPFLNIQTQVTYDGEQGLLGMAFDPDYANNGFFYISYIDTLGDTQISRFTVSSDPDSADAASETPLFHWPQPYVNHNGGDLDFGPDGNLYIPLGDGGSGCDPQGNAQDLSDPLGDIMRIHPEPDGTYTIPSDNPHVTAGPDTMPEIWASGLRNPFRFGFDRLTGDLWIGDVGQSGWEEIDFRPAGDNSGPNFGWDCREGFASSSGPGSNCDTTGCPPASAFVDPIVVQMNGGQVGGTWCAIVGGRVYRGTRWPHLYGRYYYTDFCAERFRSIRPDGLGGWIDEEVMVNLQAYFTCIAEGADGELYTGNLGAGKIYKFIDHCPMDPPSIIQNGSALESSAANAYQWFLNGDTIPGAIAQSYDPLQTGDYFVMADFGNGCLLSSDTLNFIFTSIGGATVPDLFVAPVPAHDRLSVHWSGTGVHAWRLIDASGRTQSDGQVHANDFTIATERLATGGYLLQLLSSDGGVVAARHVAVAH